MRTDGYLRGKLPPKNCAFGGFRSPAANKKAIIAVAHKLIVIIFGTVLIPAPWLYQISAPTITTREPDKERRVASSPQTQNSRTCRLKTPTYTVTNRSGFAAVAGGSRLPWSYQPPISSKWGFCDCSLVS